MGLMTHMAPEYLGHCLLATPSYEAPEYLGHCLLATPSYAVMHTFL